MLTILTGLPGAGKTLYLLGKLLSQYRGRKIYTYNIPGIDHEYFKTIELEDPEEWYSLPEGSVVVIDEAQKIFPLRKAGAAVPRKCSEIETHRHRGLDVILLTQDAGTIDIHFRKLAGRHIHVSRLFGTQSVNVYEYANWESRPMDKTTRQTAVQSGAWRYPKQIFDHYKSADLHTVKRRIPKKLLFIPIMVLLAIAAAGFAIYKVQSFFESSGELVQDIDNEVNGQKITDKKQRSFNQLSYQQSFIPAVAGLPWTAPAYNKIRAVNTYPKPLCYTVQETTRVRNCFCYTQQITKMVGVPDAVCREIAEQGWFDYSKRPERTTRRRSETDRGERIQSFDN